jgi:L-cystine uptake protein TcyP (sodium:dicarboxylate symporter family)
MFTTEEQKFIVYWEANREKQKKLFYQLLIGLPLGLLFAVPILVNFFMGRFWYKRADSVGVSQFNPMVLIIAVVLIAVFIGVFNKKFKWDQNEQFYLELKAREKRAGENKDREV